MTASRTPQTQTTASEERYATVRRVTLVGAAVDFALGVGKIFVGAAVHSQALIADGLHSLSDLVTDVMVIWAARHASRAPDASHPYGHQRIETMAAVVLGLVLVLVAGGIAYDALAKLVRGDAGATPGAWSLAIAAASIVSKEAIYQYTARAARRLDSDLLMSNAWHSRTDALSSLVVIAGLVGAMLGYPAFDAVAAILVAGMITWIGWTITRNGARELVDTAVDADQTRQIQGVAIGVEGVGGVHDLRTRRMGSDIVLDGHILLAEPTVSVSEGHRIGESVRRHLKKSFPNMHDITIHVDAEDDQAHQRSAHLPLRAELLDRLKRYWEDVPGADSMVKTVFHYLDGGVQVEAWLPLSGFEDIGQAQQAAQRLRESVASDPDIQHIDILFC
jgi:cation diffusion facilitator family transporter